MVEGDAKHREDAQYLNVGVAWCARCVLRSFLQVRRRYMFGAYTLVVDYALRLCVHGTLLYKFEVYENM